MKKMFLFCIFLLFVSLKSKIKKRNWFIGVGNFHAINKSNYCVFLRNENSNYCHELGIANKNSNPLENFKYFKGKRFEFEFSFDKKIII